MASLLGKLEKKLGVKKHEKEEKLDNEGEVKYSNPWLSNREPVKKDGTLNKTAFNASKMDVHLTRAVQFGNLQQVKIFLENGANPNQTEIYTSQWGQKHSALNQLMQPGPILLKSIHHPRIFEALLEAGADPELKNSQGFNAVDLAYSSQMGPTVALLENWYSENGKTMPEPQPMANFGGLPQGALATELLKKHQERLQQGGLLGGVPPAGVAGLAGLGFPGGLGGGVAPGVGGGATVSGENKFCTKCGKPRQGEEDAFCGSCGKKF
eukprot:TRINITY_DN61972_c0_g2_i1.p1 TRINITY_DN61972_c0_g2~~TRINITY_DN61972_c0_g2_i1.p1  ORF type:complete len:267 (-),score=27.10 TRINITY_DN61972_c0_g2_i1:50-850(-)